MQKPFKVKGFPINYPPPPPPLKTHVLYQHLAEGGGYGSRTTFWPSLRPKVRRLRQLGGCPVLSRRSKTHFRPISKRSLLGLGGVCRVFFHFQNKLPGGICTSSIVSGNPPIVSTCALLVKKWAKNAFLTRTPPLC